MLFKRKLQLLPNSTITPLMRINWRLINFETESPLTMSKSSRNIASCGIYIHALFQWKTYNDLLHSWWFNNLIGFDFNTEALTLEYSWEVPKNNLMFTPLLHTYIYFIINIRKGVSSNYHSCKPHDYRRKTTQNIT